MEELTINFISGPFLPIPPIKGGGVEVYLYNLSLVLSKKYKVRIYTRRYGGLKSHDKTGNLEIIRINGFEKRKNHLLELLKEFSFSFFVFFSIKKADINHFFHLKSFIFYLLRPNKGRSVVHLQIPFAGLTSKFLRFADIIVPNSEYTASHFKKIKAIKDNEMVVIPNGVDIKKFSEAKASEEIKERYRLTGYKIIGYVGRISKEKGIEYLIDAFRILKEKRDDVRLLLIGPYRKNEYGDPIFYAHLNSIIKIYNLEKYASFTGLMEHEKLPSYYASCDILCFPSDWEEPFGIVCIEALACGKPVIVTDSGAFREIITNGLNGFIVPKKDPSAITEKVMLLLNDDALRYKISTAALERAKSYSFNVIAQRYEELYKRLI